MNTDIILSLAIGIPVVLFFSIFMWRQLRYADVFDKGIKKAKKDLPQISKDLGFELIESDGVDGINGIEGRYETYLISISPNDPSVIDVELRNEVNIHLSNDEPSRSHLNEGMEKFDFQNLEVNKLFKTRFASKLLIEKLHMSKEIASFVDIFNDCWSSKISRIQCSQNVLHVRFRYGVGSYIPSKYIEPIIKDLVKLASKLDLL